MITVDKESSECLAFLRRHLFMAKSPKAFFCLYQGLGLWIANRGKERTLYFPASLCDFR
jgi:hypothetical protein